MNLIFSSDRCNERSSTMTVDAFCKENIPNITFSKINDINTAIGEALCNVRDHAYPNGSSGPVHLMCDYREDNTLVVTITDSGCGIKNIKDAIKPGWRSKEGFAGLGFTVMDSMCDKFEVSTTNPNKGTKVTMTFNLKKYT